MNETATPTAPSTSGCCSQSHPEPPPTAGRPCCGTRAEAAADGSCCGSQAKAEAVTAGQGCCG
jgi:hypothetical protein